MAQKTFRELLTDINKGNFAPVYILMGEESYYIDTLMNAIENKCIDPDDKDFNQSIYYGSDADMEAVIASCQQLPLMSTRRLVLLKEAQSKMQAKQQLEKLAPYVANPNASTIFALSFKGDNLNATSKLLKAATKNSNCIIFKSDKVKDYQLPALLKDYCVLKKVTIEERALNLLCQYIGAPLSKLFGEVNKLITIKGGEGSRITALDIENNIGISKDFNNYELISAIASKDYPKAVMIIKYFESNPKTNPTVMTTAALFNYFSNLVIAHYTQDKSENSLKNATGIRFQTAYKELIEGMRNYNAFKSVMAVHAIRNFDVESKGVQSFQNEYHLLLELIFKIFTL